MGDAGSQRVDLVEVFSSFQGEGPHVGRSTLFVRLAGCDLRCAWCDSPGTWLPGNVARVETSPASGERERVASPVELSHLIPWLERLEAPRHRFVSLTGGEPLLQPAAVGGIARWVRERGGRVLLETHGLHGEAMARVARDIDVVSMDWKLASDVRRASEPKGVPARPFHAEHERFLRAARDAGEVYVKLVVTAASRDEEIDEACRRIASIDRSVALVIQPVTPFATVKEAPDVRRLLGWLRRCEAVLDDVRLIPQTHKVIGAP